MNTKELVLTELLAAKGTAVSGEQIAHAGNVTRAAIWKAVKSLRHDGYDIIGTPNGGYVLQNEADLLILPLVLHYVSTHFSHVGIASIECFSEIDSTNSYAKRLLAGCGSLRNEKGELTESGKKYHKAVIIAESQTAGRGRLGRTFYSPSKTGVYVSLVYAPSGGIMQPACLTACTAVGVCRAIKKLYGVDSAIKWVNDIFINGKKVGGILTEGITNFETGAIETAIVGIGINIAENSDAIPVPSAGAILFKNHENTVKRYELAAEIAGQVFSVYEENHNKVIAEYKKQSFLIGKTVTVHPVIGDTEVYDAKVIDIDTEAALIVACQNGEQKRLIAGEVSLHSSEIQRNL